MERFSFGNAISHWSNTRGPGAFVWKYALAYAVIGVVIAAIGFVVGGPIAVTGGVDPVTGEFDMSLLPRVLAYYAWSLLAGIVFWAMFEAAAQRRYQRETGFSLGFGADELRLIVVGIFWLLTVIGLYLAIFIPVGFLATIAATASPELALALGAILGIAGLAAFLWIVTRLSPAAALTIRDRKITFTGAFGATKGRFWPMFGAFIVVGLIAIVVVLVLYLILAGVVVGLMFATIDFSAGEPTPEEILSALLTPQSIAVGGVLGVLAYFVIGIIQFAMMGIPALAARTDPRGGGGSNPSDVFV